MDFESLWKFYPRRTAKAHAKMMWDRLTDEEKILALEALPNHIKMWEMEHRDKCHIPHAGTWLNPVMGRRWEDEIELPKPKIVEQAWWGSESLILAKGKEMNLEPRPGESTNDFKGRVADKLRKAA